MAAVTPQGQGPGSLSPAEREARWDLTVHLAIQAADEKQAGTVLSRALAELRRELPLRGSPVIRPRQPRSRDDIWIAVLEPDLTHLPIIEPDNAQTRCSFVQNHFPLNAGWTAPLNSERKAKREWPPGIWQEEPGREYVLLHPVVRAILIFCEEKQVQ